jgi:hypothetical protein
MTKQYEIHKKLKAVFTEEQAESLSTLLDTVAMGSLVTRRDSWVYYVMNPILDGLEREKSWLEKENLTWRFDRQKSEFIWPVREYIEERHTHIYQHFLRHFGRWEEVFQQHDLLLQNSESLAQNILTHLSQTHDFMNLCQEKIDVYLQQEGEYPGGSVPQSKFPLLVIEHLVNGIRELPEHYCDADFWSRLGDGFREAYHRLSPELVQQLKETKLQFLVCVQRISKDLGDQCYQLCEEYDIPADPCNMEMKRCAHETRS